MIHNIRQMRNTPLLAIVEFSRDLWYTFQSFHIFKGKSWRERTNFSIPQSASNFRSPFIDNLVRSFIISQLAGQRLPFAKEFWQGSGPMNNALHCVLKRWKPPCFSVAKCEVLKKPSVWQKQLTLRFSIYDKSFFFSFIFLQLW